MRAVTNLLSDIDTTAVSLDNISGIKLKDYQALYNQYVYDLQGDCIKLCNFLGYRLDDSFKYGSYHIYDNRTDKEVLSSTGKKLPMFHTNGGKTELVAHYISKNIAILFIFDLYKLELPDEIASKIKEYEKSLVE